MKKYSNQYQWPLTPRCKPEWVALSRLDGDLPPSRHPPTPSNKLFATDASKRLAALN
jgi:hypothetical protein